ncbi:MAG TPA: FG-GAP-like repeat-containing protein, partial [Isosphaeraceae bacterium]
MEQYDYGPAVAAYREVHRLAPGWIPGAINLAIALLNDTGSQDEESRPGADAPAAGHYDEALALLRGVLARDPGNLHARYCRGIILQQLGDLAGAHADFRFVVERDPTDGHAWFWVASTLLDPDSPPPPAPPRPAGPKQARQLIELFEKALACNPYLDPALFRLQTAYAWAGDRARQKRVLALRDRLNPDRLGAVPGPGETAEAVYGSMGRYAQVVGPTLPRPASSNPGPPPRFEDPAPIEVRLPEGRRWAMSEDFTGPQAVIGRVRDRFGATVAAFDADGDGRTDLFLASAVVGPGGIGDVLLWNRGDGTFEEVTAAFGLDAVRSSLGAAAGDFDADGHVDLFLTGVGDNRLYRNLGTRRFEDVTERAGLTGPSALSLTARWLDLDQDGDLDLYAINYSAAEHADAAFADPGGGVPGLANAAYRNDGKPAPVTGSPEATWAPAAVASGDSPAVGGLSIAFSPWADAPDLLGGASPHTAVAALDVDDDRDVDL